MITIIGIGLAFYFDWWQFVNWIEIIVLIVLGIIADSPVNALQQSVRKRARKIEKDIEIIKEKIGITK